MTKIFLAQISFCHKTLVMISNKRLPYEIVASYHFIFETIMGASCSVHGCLNEPTTCCIGCQKYLCTNHSMKGYCEKCYQKMKEEEELSEVCIIS